MSEKSALFMARTTRFHEFARSLTTTLGVEVSLATPDSPTAAHDFDLLILDSDGIRSDRIDQIAKWLDDRGGVPMLGSLTTKHSVPCACPITRMPTLCAPRRRPTSSRRAHSA